MSVQRSPANRQHVGSRATRAGQRRLRRLLLATGAASTALVLLCALASLLAVAVTARSYQELDRRVQPAQLATAELEAALSDSSRGMRGYLVTGEPAFLDAYRRGMTDYPVALSRLRALQRGQAEQQLIDRQDTQAQAWFALYQHVPDAAPPTPQQAEPTLVRGKQLLDTFLADSDQLRTVLQQRQSELQERVGRIHTLLIGSLLALGLSAAGAVATVAMRTARAVTGPLAELQHALGRLTAGQHATRVTLRPAAPKRCTRSPPASTHWPRRASGCAPWSATGTACTTSRAASDEPSARTSTPTSPSRRPPPRSARPCAPTGSACAWCARTASSPPSGSGQPPTSPPHPPTRSPTRTSTRCARSISTASLSWPPTTSPPPTATATPTLPSTWLWAASCWSRPPATPWSQCRSPPATRCSGCSPWRRPLRGPGRRRRPT